MASENRNPKVDLELYEIMNRVLCDNVPEPVDLVYLHAETKDNESSSFCAGARFYSEGFTPKIGITWADSSVYEEMMKRYEEKNPELIGDIRKRLNPKEDGSMAGYLGFKHWKRNLINLGVEERDILLIEPSFDYPHLTTDTEARGLIDYCKQRGIERVCITAVPFQQVRAFISDVSALLQEGATDLKLYSRTGEPLDWNKEVVHSQGVKKGKRKEFIESECEKIYRYQREGNPRLSSLREILNYLDRRG